MNEPRPKLRWRIIPTLLLGIFDACGVLGFVVETGMMVAVYRRVGIVDEDPNTPTLNRYRVSRSNVLRNVFIGAIGACGLAAATAWWKLRKRSAVVLTVANVGLNVFGKLVGVWPE